MIAGAGAAISQGSFPAAGYSSKSATGNRD